MFLVALLAGCVTPESEPEVERSQAAVAAAHPLAAQAGAEVLLRGGNAIDAAAAVQFALNVVEPQMSGMGGGGFLVYYDAGDDTVHMWDGREVAPEAADAEMFLDGQGEPMAFRDAQVSGKAVGVPGTLALWDEALGEFGSMGLSEVVQPAVSLADDGFEVYGHLADYIEANEWKLTTWPESAALFFPGSACVPTQAGFEATHAQVPRCVGGEPLAQGDWLVQPDLARTLREVGEKGPGVFYEGPAGEALVEAVQERDGAMTMEDLRSYEVVRRQPLLFAWGDHEMASMTVPGGGPVVAQILGLVDGFDLDPGGLGSTDYWHVLLEAMRLSYADRGEYLADPDHVKVPLKGLLDPDYLQQRAHEIEMDRAQGHRPGDPWAFEDPDDENDGADGGSRDPGKVQAPRAKGHTTHFSVVDHEGNIASVTTTIEQVFGSGMMVPGHGFMLNNELTDFDFEPGGANEVGPGKRPRSSMSPSIVFTDGEPVLTVGSPGGATIMTSVSQVIANNLLLGMDLEKAIAAPRLYSPTHPDVGWESGFSSALRSELEERGHAFADDASRYGSVQGIERLPDGTWNPVADTRSAPGGAVVVPVDDAQVKETDAKAG